jgi:hypothetical protein
MRFGSRSGSSAVSSVRTGSVQQTQLVAALLAVAAVALIGFVVHKSLPPAKPALNTAEERRQFIQSEAPDVKRIALDKVVPFAVSDKIAKEGYQEDAKDIDNVVIGVVTYTYKNQFGDAVYSQCFGSTQEWTYDSLKALVGSDMMDAVRAEVIRNYEEILKQARQQEGQRR